MSDEKSGQEMTSQMTRRAALKSIAGLAAAGAWPLSSHASDGPATFSGSINPRWYGFNLLEYFSIDQDWMQHFPYKLGDFVEDDFRWMRDWGFNFARLPMDYRLWTDPRDTMKIDEKRVEPIDRAIRLGEKYGVHINICLCRAPGEWIQDDANPKITGIREQPEKTSVYTDKATFDAFVHQWDFFAARYKGIPARQLSFNLVNEPLERGVDHAVGLRDYTRLAQASIAAIRARDASRLIVSDGYQVAHEPVAALYNSGVMQSCHDYQPVELTHFRVPWLRPLADQVPVPTWPLKDKNGKVIADRETLRTFLRPWAEPARHGSAIHFGEMGCGGHTPPAVVYAWFNDSLDLINELKSGWALWNFRGQFGILDTGRPGVRFTDWHGHRLDGTLLKLLQSKMRA